MSNDRSRVVLARIAPLLTSLSSDSKSFTPSDAEYTLHSEPFAIQKQQNPALVLVPGSTIDLSKILRFLYAAEDVEFAIRNHGFKSPSARDVIISLLNFQGFEYDHARKLATVGVANTWSDVVKSLEAVDPGYSGEHRLPPLNVKSSAETDQGDFPFSHCCPYAVHWRWWHYSERRFVLDVHRVWLYQRPRQFHRRRGSQVRRFSRHGVPGARSSVGPKRQWRRVRRYVKVSSSFTSTTNSPSHGV